MMSKRKKEIKIAENQNFKLSLAKGKERIAQIVAT